ncbi:MAG: RNA polymerase sigma factor [Planctomycetes bacterium]|nr:RNA polymerase sigma factor [Planctomycetota bacterium]
MKVEPPAVEVDGVGGELDARALEDAFARFEPELLGTLYYLVGNIEDARDVLQETFLKCWRHRDEVADVRNLRAWIFSIAANAGRDHRRTVWHKRRRPLARESQMPADHRSNGQADLESREQLARVRQALGDLRLEEQEVFLLRQNGEMTYEDIARALDIPVNTAKTRMRLALDKLRRALARE